MDTNFIFELKILVMERLLSTCLSNTKGSFKIEAVEAVDA